MNRDGHVLNAVLLSVGLGYVLHPTGGPETFEAIAQVTIPVVLGALFPDVDTAYGAHRKTFHNLFVLGVFLVFPVYFGNLEFVWIGVLTHYVLDLFGSRRGLALFYPLSRREYAVPFGVSVDSRFAGTVTLAVTAIELAVAGLLVYGLPAGFLAGVGLAS